MANKLYSPGTVSLQVKGLPKGTYALSTKRVDFSTAGRQSVWLHVDDTLPPGIYPVTIYAKSDSGWQGHFQHRARSHQQRQIMSHGKRHGL